MQSAQALLLSLGLLSLSLVFCGIWLFYRRQVYLARRCTDRWF